MPKSPSNIFTFDQYKFEQALRKECNEIMKRTRDLLYKETLENLNAIKYNDFIVPMASGRLTSDKLRKMALVKSVVAKKFSWEGYMRKMRIRLSSMGSNFKDSHIGWYYEYGTGRKYHPPKSGNSLPSMGTPNPHRAYGSGTRLVTRSKSDGNWTDMGGNTRKATSVVGGRHIRDAYEVDAYRWMEKSLKTATEYAMKELAEVHKKVNQAMFLKGNKIIMR